jgi:DNA anti-recombination protein RmuC
MEYLTLLNEQAQGVDGMNDVSFTMKDVIYIVSLVVSIAAFIFRMKIDKEKMSHKIEALESTEAQREKTYQEAIMHAKNGRKEIRKEFENNLKEREQVLHARIDRVRDDNIKSYEKLEKRIEDLDRKQDSNKIEIIAAINNAKR